MKKKTPTKKAVKRIPSKKKSIWKWLLFSPFVIAGLLFLVLWVDYLDFKIEHERCVQEDEELYRREGWRTYACPDYRSFFHYINSVYVKRQMLDAKPIIYLYPEKITNVTVALGYPENATHTYPKYQGPWQVQAEPNGDLTDLKNGRHYYALYWEGKNTVSASDITEGFVVAGKDTISFLEKKLDQLGLTEREAEEFIVYWLPKLESAPYNLIRFQTLAEQNKNMPLKITPAPQTLIRVMMEYRSLDKKIEITEQKLPIKPERTGFTVVEWGGTNLEGEVK